MKKKQLTDIISEVLAPEGFKKKGNYWVINGDEITKMVNLQKSQYSNSFYINYGYILNAIPLDDMMHIYIRVASTDKNDNRRIDELLNLESHISSEDRANQLKKLLIERLIPNLQNINTEEDVLNELKSRPHLNAVPLVVKKHFNLME